MPCADCIEIKAELAAQKTFMTNWFQVFLGHIESAESQAAAFKKEVLERLRNLEETSRCSPAAVDVSQGVPFPLEETEEQRTRSSPANNNQAQNGESTYDWSVKMEVGEVESSSGLVSSFAGIEVESTTLHSSEVPGSSLEDFGETTDLAVHSSESLQQNENCYAVADCSWAERPMSRDALKFEDPEIADNISTLPGSDHYKVGDSVENSCMGNIFQDFQVKQRDESEPVKPIEGEMGFDRERISCRLCSTSLLLSPRNSKKASRIATDVRKHVLIHLPKCFLCCFCDKRAVRKDLILCHMRRRHSAVYKASDKPRLLVSEDKLDELIRDKSYECFPIIRLDDEADLGADTMGSVLLPGLSNSLC